MIYKRIYADIITARKAIDKTRLALLCTLAGEMSAKAKFDKSTGEKTVTDEDAIALLKSWLKKQDEILSMENIPNDLIEQTNYEKFVLIDYMPNQLSEEEIRKSMMDSVYETMPDLMKLMSSNFKGQYDGKLASTIAKEIAEKKKLN